MKPRFLILVVVACCVVISGLAGFWGRSAPRPVPTSRFLCLTNGVPGNSSLTGLGEVAVFSRLSTRHAVLVQDWLNAGTNAAMFSISNSLDRAISLLPAARLATSKDKDGWGQQTPLLLSAGQSAGVYLRPGQAATVQVALIAHEGAWRIQFCYLLGPTDDGLLKTVIAKLNGTASRGASGFMYSDWVKP